MPMSKSLIATLIALPIVLMSHLLPQHATADDSLDPAKRELPKLAQQGFSMYPVTDKTIAYTAAGMPHRRSCPTFGNFAIVEEADGDFSCHSLYQQKPSAWLGTIDAAAYESLRNWRIFYAGFNKDKSKVCFVTVQGTAHNPYAQILKRKRGSGVFAIHQWVYGED